MRKFRIRRAARIEAAVNPGDVERVFHLQSSPFDEAAGPVPRAVVQIRVDVLPVCIADRQIAGEHAATESARTFAVTETG